MSRASGTYGGYSFGLEAIPVPLRPKYAIFGRNAETGYCFPGSGNNGRTAGASQFLPCKKKCIAVEIDTQTSI